MGNLKYELIKAEKNERGLKYRAKALKDFGNIRRGDLSGLISDGNSISQLGNCWVYYYAEMHDKARICGDAILYDRAKMFGNTKMHENAKMFGDTKMYDNSMMGGDAQMHGKAEMHDIAMMVDESWMFDRAKMYGESKMHDRSEMHDDSEIHDNSEMYGYTVIGGTHKLEDKILRYPKLYKYISRPILDGSEKVTKIMMGCHTRTIDEWRRDFRNNTLEFPVGSKEEVDRLNALNYVLMTLGEDQIQLEIGLTNKKGIEENGKLEI